MSAVGADDVGLDKRWDTGLVGLPGSASVASSDGSLDGAPDGGLDSGLDNGPDTGLDTGSGGECLVAAVAVFSVVCARLGSCEMSISR